jgi:exosortase E/protease (VPEID-CTERM system)
MRRSSSIASPGAGRVSGTRQLPVVPLAWLIGVGSLPLVELAYLSVRFDSGDLVARGGSLGWIVAATGEVGRAAVPLLAALALIAAARIADLVDAIQPALAEWRPWVALSGHLVCAAIVVWLTEIVFASPQVGGGVLAAWVASGVAATVLWGAALFPGVARSGRGPLIAGTMAMAAGLGLLAAGAATMTREWWQPLGYVTLQVVYRMLQALGYQVGVEPARFLVGTPRFVAEITPYCSGYQGVGLMLVFLGAYLYLFRDRLRFPRALWLLPIGAVLAWVLNAVRLAALVAIGDAGHEKIAVQGFHYHAGTLLFCVTALGLGVWAGSSRIFSTVAHRGSWGVDRPTAAYVLPFVALLATSLVTGLVSHDGLDALYGLRLVVAGVVLWAGRGHLAQAGWRLSWGGAGLGVVAFGVWLALAGRGYLIQDFGPALAALEPAPRLVWLGLRLLGSVVVVPVVEEVAFRGYLARRLTAADFASVPLDRITWPALLASAAVFGLMHHDVTAGVAAGVLYGIAARRRGQLGDAVLAHAVTNALLAAAALHAHGWSLLA